MDFELHQNFQKKIFLVDLPLCRILLENEYHYPWLLLIPRRHNISKIMDLSFEDQYQLLQELDVAQKALWNEFQPSQLNVAALGNKTPQLHVHVIARFQGDPAWPGGVWDHPIRAHYSSDQLNRVMAALKEAFKAINSESM